MMVYYQYFRMILLLMLLLVSSCVSHHELINFQEVGSPSEQVEEILNATQLRIQPEDLLRIVVHSYDPLAVAPFNIEGASQGSLTQGMIQTSEGGTNNLELFMGYFVDQDGFIDFPVVGRVEVEGLTLEEAKRKIHDLVDPYLKDQVVNIRFLNLKITVLGEVNRPGTIRITNKRITILEALGMAGDMTTYANRTKVLLIREKEGRRTTSRLDLQSSDIFTSPFFYLQQNDVIYVEPIRARVATVADPAQRIISYSTAGLSVISLILALRR